MSDVTVSPATTVTSDPAARRATRYAGYFFWVMFLANFVNYLQRWTFIGIGLSIERDLKINDAEFGLLASLFLLVYTLFAFPFGLLADRMSRRIVVGVGMLIGSVATVLTGLSYNLASLIGAKTLFGFGQSGFYPAGTPLLISQYPPSKRATVISRWTVGALIGTAIGFLMGGFFDESTWRWALFIIAIPGVLMAIVVFTLREKRSHELDPSAQSHDNSPTRSTWRRLRTYLGIPTFRVILAMHIFGFFAIAGIATWLPIYLGNTYGQKVTQYDSAGNVVGEPLSSHFGSAGLSHLLVSVLAGGVVILGGVFGNLYGGRLASQLSRRSPGARILAGGVGFLLSAPFVVLAISAPWLLPQFDFYTSADLTTQLMFGLAIFTAFGLLASFFLNVYNGPTSAALLDIIPPSERAAAGGAELFLAHLFGDVHATFVIGAIAVLLTQQFGGEQIGAALLVTAPVALVIAGIVGIWGSRYYKRDVEALGTTAEAMLGTSAAAAQ
jgi:MFS family permease